MIRHGKNQHLITIHGIVSPAGWGENGQIDAVCIATSEQKLYFVRNQSLGLNLLDCIKREVVVTGILRQQADKLFIDVVEAELYFPHRQYDPA